MIYPEVPPLSPGEFSYRQHPISNTIYRSTLLIVNPTHIHTYVSGCHLDLITIVHFWLCNTAHCTERIVFELLSVGSVSAEGVGQGKWVGWGETVFLFSAQCDVTKSTV